VVTRAKAARTAKSPVFMIQEYAPFSVVRQDYLELEGRKPNLKKHRTEVTEVTQGEEKGAWPLNLAIAALPIPLCSLRVLSFSY
jgi:hypothetical protein